MKHWKTEPDEPLMAIIGQLGFLLDGHVVHVRIMAADGFRHAQRRAR